MIADGGMQPAFQTKIFTDPELKANADNPVTGFIRYLSVHAGRAPLRQQGVP